MKTISKRFVVIMLAATVIMSGCKKNDSDNKADSHDNLDFQQVTENTEKSVTSPYESYDYKGSYFVWIDPKLNLKEALEEDSVPPYAFEENVIYTGEKLTYRVYMYNFDNEPKTRIFFMNANGHMQSFQVNNGKTVDYYTVTIQPNEEKDITFTFDPICAPLQEKGEIKIFSYEGCEKNDELISVMQKNESDYGAAYISRKAFDFKKISIQADSKENEKNIEICKNEMGKDSMNSLKSDDEETKNFTSGITFGEAFTNASMEGFIHLNLKWNPTDTLYARALCYGGYNVRIFLIMDGELLPAFNGQYFADFNQKVGVVHNIPLDSEALPKEGKHIMNGFICYENPTEDIDDVDIVYPILLDVQS